MKVSARNLHVESAVNDIISRVDEYIGGANLKNLPKQETLSGTQLWLDSQRGSSVKLASIFLLSYSLADQQWDFKSVPTGIRGQYGDKRLAAELTKRHVTFHNAITAFGENLGWKGNVRQFSLDTDQRFLGFINLVRPLNAAERSSLLDYICSSIADSRAIPKALPKLPEDYLSYARAACLFDELARVPSEGHIQQFLIAAILHHHRKRMGAEVVTHHPHASDKFDGTSGDIEEFFDGTLINAYEVTVRSDWRNRVPDLRQKMVDGNLSRYVLIASDVANDAQLSDPKQLIQFVASTQFDLVIVDLYEFLRGRAQTPSATFLRDNVAWEKSTYI